MVKKICVALGLFSVMSAAHAEDALGSRNNPFRIVIVPSGQAAKALDSAKPVAKCIEDKAKIFVTVQVPKSYIAVVEAIGANKADLAFGDIVSFLLAQKKFDAEPLLQVVRYGTKSYQSAIYVKTKSSIKTVKDLNGKKFGFSDASSASSYIYPSILMKQNGIKFAQEVATGSMESSVIALMHDQVEAAATYYNPPDAKTGKINDARSRVETTYPKIAEDTRVLWISKPIPNEPIFIRKNVPNDLKPKLSMAIANCVKEYPKMINNIEELAPVKSEEKVYDSFIKEVETSGLDIATIFSKSKH